jgi:hypothetical protein
MPGPTAIEHTTRGFEVTCRIPDCGAHLVGASFDEASTLAHAHEADVHGIKGPFEDVPERSRPNARANMRPGERLNLRRPDSPAADTPAAR